MQKFDRSRVANLVLPIVFINELTVIDATPSVLNCLVHKCINIAPFDITNFSDGADGQTIRILGDGFTTVKNNATIKTNTTADKLLAAYKVYSFTLIEEVWYEAE